MKRILNQELSHLKSHDRKAIMISTTAKHALDFLVLPRRTISDMSMSCFMINNEKPLKETLSFFDGEIDYIYIDIEQKQSLNLFRIARSMINKSQLVTVKPNDTTLESCDLLIRHCLNDNLYNKKVVVIGTGNLASKIATRLAERQANVYIIGRSTEKEKTVVKALNLFLPKNTHSIESFKEIQLNEKANVVVSFLSGEFTKEDALLPVTGKNTFIIDGGINNFSSDFIQLMLKRNIKITRLDTRIAFPYQMLSAHDYTQTFFTEVYGETLIQGVTVASGGYIGSEGTVIVDNIKRPNQVIGIADGSGGVKASERITESDRRRIQEIEKAISASN